ncbi:hypothetical protein [Sorangium sp. So ce124]|uniref:hypothetical protein n=1 Tax=Sorangium sp. So ce124 TaxID=3133280 RepID=UPI003F5FE00A
MRRRSPPSPPAPPAPPPVTELLLDDEAPPAPPPPVPELLLDDEPELLLDDEPELLLDDEPELLLDDELLDEESRTSRSSPTARSTLHASRPHATEADK